LLDGQNRLIACTRALAPFSTHVVFGVDDLAFSVIDIGTKRTNADALKIKGITRYKIAAPALRWLMIYESGNPEDRGQGYENKTVLERHGRMNNAQKSVFDYATLTALNANTRMPKPSLAAHLYMFHEKDEKCAGKLVADLIARKGNMRKFMSALDDAYLRANGRLHELATNAMLIVTWNTYRKGIVLTKTLLSTAVTGHFPIVE
jgi:hypothetical protein